MKKYLFTAVLALFTLVITAQVKVEPPVLKTPADSSINHMPNVILDWNAVIGASEYQLQVGYDNEFNNIVLDSITDLAAIQASQLFFGTYFSWRVRAIYPNGDISGWSDIWAFKTFERIALFRPNDNATDQYPDLLLRWNEKVVNIDVSGVEFFNLEIDTTATFDSPLLKQYTTAGEIFEKKMTDLYFGEVYHWRVKAGHALHTADWSLVRTFTTINQIALDKPNNNATKVELNPVLSWDNKLTGFTRFEIQIDDNEDFSSPDVELAEQFSFQMQGLHYGVTYYWRIRGRHSLDTTGWSLVRNFNTAAHPTLLSPDDGDTNIVLRPLLSWEKIMGTVKYEIDYCDDLDLLCENKFFRDAYDNEDPILNVNTELIPNTLYYWRVRAYSANDTSEYSPIWTFTTLEPMGINAFADNQALVVFPNPAQDVLTIQLNNNSNTEVDIALYDLLGQEILTQKITFAEGISQRNVMLDKVPNGIYLLKLTKGEQVFSSKIVVSK
jgi:hypothetical protein